MKRRFAALLIALAAAGCGGKTGQTTPTGPTDPTDPITQPPDGGPVTVGTNDGNTMNKTPNAGGGTFVRGVALTPKDKLLAWLESQKVDGKPRLLRLPIVLPMGQIGFDIAKARVGAGADALEVYANDSSLGIGLADRARQACKGAKPPTCAFWVEGYWRGEAMGSYELEVNKAELLPADQLAGATFAEVQGESSKH